MFNYFEAVGKYCNYNAQMLLHKYVKLILQWNRKINITSKHNGKSRIYDFICEAIAMSQLLGNDKLSKIVDIGSGGGFPAIPLSILGFKNIYLVEINYKKAAFLQYVVAELGLKAKVYNEDVRNVVLSEVDYITSKAVATSSELISLSSGITCDKSEFILCKNKDDCNLGFSLKEVVLSDNLNVERKYNFITYRK
jgi:16S rRNA (guanine527-N7)-methyltransferase